MDTARSTPSNIDDSTARAGLRATGSLSDQLAERVLARIKAHVYAQGVRLPSVRAAAHANALSPATVVAAYDKLIAQGHVEARPQRGFYVRSGAKQQNSALFGSNDPSVSGFIQSNATKNIASENATYKQRHDLYTSASPAANRAGVAPPPAPTHATALIRGMFRPASGLPQPSQGVLPSAWMDTPFLSTALRRVAGNTRGTSADRAMWVEYGDPAGDMQLRCALAQRLQAFGIHTHAEHMVTSIGATHALDIASRALLRPGDAVMVEEPGWTVEFARLAALGMRILPVARGPLGPDVAAIARHCLAPNPLDRPKLLVSVSVLHNPTGAALSPAVAHQVLTLAKAHDFHILEDDTYAHFAPEHATRLAALDHGADHQPGLERVIYVGGFAKALAPNWRVGFLAAPPHLVERMVDTKMLSTLTTPALMERALAHIIEAGHLRKHCERIKTQLDAARSRSVRLATAHGCSFAAEPAGFFGWVDVGADTDRLAPALLDRGYLIAPGSLFYATRRPTNLMRINFATTQNAEFWQVLDKVRAAS